MAMRFMGLGPYEHCDEPLGEEPGVGMAVQLLNGYAVHGVGAL